MNHAEAVQTKTSEKYLLGELTASQEDEFAEHFFDCEECSNDLRMTSLFLQTTKKVLAEDRVPKVNPTARKWASAWRYAVAACVGRERCRRQRMYVRRRQGSSATGSMPPMPPT